MLDFILIGLATYFGVGLVFAIAFALKGFRVIDEDAAGAGVKFRLLIIPAASILWPLLLGKWMKAGNAS